MCNSKKRPMKFENLRLDIKRNTSIIFFTCIILCIILRENTVRHFLESVVLVSPPIIVALIDQFLDICEYLFTEIVRF